MLISQMFIIRQLVTQKCALEVKAYTIFIFFPSPSYVIICVSGCYSSFLSRLLQTQSKRDNCQNLHVLQLHSCDTYA